MNALDSPLEALAFDYLSFGLLTAVNNVWTWVAVITAAVSVWRFRAISPRGKFADEEPLITSVSSSTSSAMVERVAAEPASTSKQVEAAPPSTKAPSLCVFNREGSTSGRKVTFYYDKEEDDNTRDDGNGEVDGEAGNVRKEWLGNGWEITMRMRKGDNMGFYRYQDLTVLDGSVVRLWDNHRGRSADAPLISCGGDEGSLVW